MKHWAEVKIVEALKNRTPYKAICAEYHTNNGVIAMIKKRNGIILKPLCKTKEMIDQSYKYICDQCGKFRWSDVGNTFTENNLEGAMLCEDCMEEWKKEKSLEINEDE